MAQRFILTAQLQLAAPANVAAVVRRINAQLRGINANVNININNANTQLNQLTRNIRGAGTAARAAKNDIEKFGEQAAIAIRRYGAFTLATTAFIKLSNAIGSGIDEAIKYDREMVRIAQVTGKSTGSLKDLNDEVTRLATTFGVSSTKILDSAQTLAQAGLSAKEVKVALEALAKTNVSATFGDIKNTTEASIAIMQQFGKEAKDLEGILSSINAVSAKFAVESEDIAVAVRRAGGAFEAAGGNLHEFQALFTSVRQTTRESAETIATGFRTIFTRLQRNRTQNFLQSIGIDLKDVEGQFVGPYEAVRRLSAALKDLRSTDPRFAQIIEELGGFRQISKVIPLITKFDVAEQALNVSMRSNNSLTEDAATAQQSLAVQLTKVKEEFLGLIRTVSSTDTFKGIVDVSLKMASSFIKVAESLTPLVPLISAFAAIKIGAGIGSFATGFNRKISGHNQGGPIHAFASGGLVPGHGDSDSVRANLTPGEYVIRKNAVKAIGLNTLQKMNKYARGGAVQHFADGTEVQGNDEVTVNSSGTEYQINGYKFTKAAVMKALNLDKGAKFKGSDNKERTFIEAVRDKQLPSNVLKTIRNTFDKNQKTQSIIDAVEHGKKVDASTGMQKAYLGHTKDADRYDYYVSGVADMVTADPNFVGKERKGVLSTTIRSILASTKSFGNAEIKEKFGLNGLSKEEREAKLSRYVEARFNIHGLNKDLSKNFEGSAEEGFKLAVNKSVGSHPISGLGLSKEPLETTDLITNGAIQTIKGYVLEGIVRQISRKAIENKKVEGLIDFDNVPPGIFTGKSSGPAEAKVAADVGDGASVLVKSLKKGVARISKFDASKRHEVQGELFDKDGNPIQRKALGGLIRFATGGHAKGTDTVPAMLTPGEFVINKSAASKLGSAALNKLNNADKVKHFATGGSVGGAASGVVNSPLAFTLLLTAADSLAHSFGGADSAIHKFTTEVSKVGIQFTVFKSLADGLRSSLGERGRNIPGNDTRSQENIAEDLRNKYQAQRETYNAKVNASSFSKTYKDRLISAHDAKIAVKEAAVDAKSERLYNSTSNRVARVTSFGAPIAGAALSYLGDRLGKDGRDQIAKGEDGVYQAKAGDTLSGIGAGAAAGAAFGPWGVAIGAATGGLLALYNATDKYEKELEKVKFAKSLEKLDIQIDRFGAGKVSAADASSSIRSSISSRFSRAFNSKADDVEKKDIKADVKNSSAAYEKYITEITKNAKSFDTLDEQTKRLMIQFSALSGISFADLKKSVEDQIKSTQQAKEFAAATTIIKDEANRNAQALNSMSQAINKVSDKFEAFGTTIDNLGKQLSGGAAASKSRDISGILEKAGRGRFSDRDTLTEIGSGLTSQFGKEGSEQTKLLADTSSVLAQLPSILRETRNRTGVESEKGTFEGQIKKVLEERGFDEHSSISKSIVAATHASIGAESKDEKIITAINDDIDQVASELGKSLHGVIDTFKELAPAFKAQTDRVRNAFAVYSQAQIKIGENEQEIQRKSEGFRSFVDDITNNHRTGGAVRTSELTRIHTIANSTNSTDLGKRLVAAQERARVAADKSSNALNPADVTKFETELEQANSEVHKTTKALNELANSSEGLSAIQKELALEEEKRKFKENIALTAVFGSREAKADLSNKIGLTNQAVRFGIDSVPEDQRHGVLEFLQSAGKQKINGVGADDILKHVTKNSAFGNLVGKDNIDKLLTPGGTDKQQSLIAEFGKITNEQQAALKELSTSFSQIGDSASKIIADTNKKFITDLRKIFFSKQKQEAEGKLSGKISEEEALNKKIETANRLNKEFGIDDSNIQVAQNTVKEIRGLEDRRIAVKKKNEEIDASKASLASVGVNDVNLRLQEAATKHGLNIKDAQKEIDAVSPVWTGSLIQKTPEELRQHKAQKAQEILERARREYNEEQNRLNSADSVRINSTPLGASMYDASNTPEKLKELETAMKELGTEGITSLTNKLRNLTKEIIGIEKEISKINRDERKVIASEGSYRGGYVGYAAAGGPVKGTPINTPQTFSFAPKGTDKYPYMLAHGEYVVNAAAVKKFGKSNLDAINAQYAAVGGSTADYDNEVEQKRREANLRYVAYLNQEKGLNRRDSDIKSIERGIDPTTANRSTIAHREIMKRDAEKQRQSAIYYSGYDSMSGLFPKKPQGNDYSHLTENYHANTNARIAELNKRADGTESIRYPQRLTYGQRDELNRQTEIAKRKLQAARDNAGTSDMERANPSRALTPLEQAQANLRKSELARGITRPNTTTVTSDRSITSKFFADKEAGRQQRIDDFKRRQATGIIKPENSLSQYEEFQNNSIMAWKKIDAKNKKKSSKPSNNGNLGGIQNGNFTNDNQQAHNGGVGVDNVAELHKVVQQFSIVVDGLTKKLNEFKDIKMSLKAEHNINVTFNGTEALAKMSPVMQEFAIAHADKAVREFAAKSFPDLQVTPYSPKQVS